MGSEDAHELDGSRLDHGPAVDVAGVLYLWQDVGSEDILDIDQRVQLRGAAIGHSTG